MKVKATKTMAKFLQERIKVYTIKFEKVSIDFFKWNVDTDYWAHEEDFDEATNKFNVIRVIYPMGYYACDRYLTTKDLNRAFKQSDGTAEDFAQKVFEEMEI